MNSGVFMVMVTLMIVGFVIFGVLLLLGPMIVGWSIVLAQSVWQSF